MQNKVKSFFVIALVIVMAALTSVAQDVAALNDPQLESFDIVASKQAMSRLDKPRKMRNLEKFVKSNFPDAFMIVETTADGGNAAVTFRQATDGKVTDTILIDRQSYIELNQDELTVSFGKQNGNGENSELLDSFADHAVDSYSANCAGVQRSPGNRYPCCDPNGTAQNCTYFAWEMAYRYWGDAIPKIGDAKDWHKLSNYGYPVAPPSGAGLFMIPVSSTLSRRYGHVCWSMEIANNMVRCAEQNCGVTTNGYSLSPWRSIATYDKGFVQTKKNLPAPYIYSSNPSTPRVSSTDQWVTFYGGNINPGARAVVIFPNGGRATLKDGQLQVGNGTLKAYIKLNAIGRWSIQVFNENGKFSGLYNFNVSN